MIVEVEPLTADRFRTCGRVFRDRQALDDLRELWPDCGTIINGGAGAGHFALRARGAFPDARIYSFEPVAALYKQLEAIESDPQQLAYQTALGDANGHANIQLTQSEKSNSLLGFLPGNPLEIPHTVIGTESVRVHKLDDLLSARPAIIKLDVQGYELKALAGAREWLKLARLVYLEAAFVQQYQDQPLLADVDAFMQQRGFVRTYLYASARPDIWGNALYVPTTEIRLNIGAGCTRLEGFTPVDRKLGSEAYPLPYQDNEVEEIRAAHILEHFSYADVPKVLEDWVRVLKPGGRIRLSVPDFDKIAELKKSDPNWRFYAMGGQSDENDFHKSAFDEPSLRKRMEIAGLVQINHWLSPNTDTASHACSLNLEGVKRSPEDQGNLDLKICAVTSIPRVGWNDHWGCVIDALRPLRIPLRRFTGAFWGQCMQNVLEGCVEDGIDWVLTLDYDTMFTAEQLDRLLGWFGESPHIDAIAALQCRRSAKTPLMTIKGQRGVETDFTPIKVDTAHFGMTLIRLDALKEIPKPWFKSVPGPDGTWTHDDRLDEDIWFWHQWREHGKTVYIAPDVRVGHLELMVSQFDDSIEAQHYYVKDWLRANSKKKVRE